MRHRLLLIALCVACMFLSNYTVAPAQTGQVWTSKKVLALKGSVVKERVKFPVKLSTGKKFTMAASFFFKVKQIKGCLYHNERGRLIACLRAKNIKKKPIQTLVHGLTYDHRYWNSQTVNGKSYSYARFMAKNGFVVLALDLLGSGKSGVPDGDQLTLQESSFTIAQVLFSLKSEQNPLHSSFEKVIVVGHSLGTILSVATLGTWRHAADALIVTGWAFAPHVVLAPELVQAAFENPYVQLPPQVREDLFYFLPKADHRVIAFDNRRLADQTPRGIFTQGLPLLEAMERGNADDVEFIKAFSRSSRIQVPVLIQLGEFDAIAPSRLASQEASFYPNASKVTVQVLSNIGHAFNLHVNNQKSWKRVKRWLTRRGY